MILKGRFENLLVSKDEGVGAAAPPLVARWDKDHELSAKVAPFVALLKRSLRSLGDDERVQLSTSLIGVRDLDPRLFPTVSKVFGSGFQRGQKKILEALGAVQDPAVGASSYRQLFVIAQRTARGGIRPNH